jgi:Na+/H+ antiporter NhaC
MTQAAPSTTPDLQMRGGVLVLFVPFLVMLAGILVLGAKGLALPEAFWPMVLLGLFVGLLLAKNRDSFVQALVSGIASPMLAVILLAWFLAGVFGTMLNQTGVIQGLVWLGTSVGLAAAWVPLLTFLASAVLSLSTGTSVGTILAVTPILFPAGFAIGADPLLIVGAIIGGAFVGDNIAPVSDTTIVSAYSQGTTVPKVVQSRLKYALVAGAVTFAFYLIVGFTGGATAGRGAVDTSPDGLIMLLAPALLIFLMIRGWHFVASLLMSIAFGIVLGLVTGLLGFGDLLSVDKASFTASGIVVEGMSGFVGVAVFTIFLMGMIGTFQAGGLIDWLVARAQERAKSSRASETSTYVLALVVNALTTAGTPTMVMLGPYVRRVGHHFKIAPWRRANVLDGASTTIIGFLPYSIAVLIPFALVSDTVAGAGLTNFDPVHLVPYVVYCWALMLVFFFAVLTGWGREEMEDAAWEREREELAARATS